MLKKWSYIPLVLGFEGQKPRVWSPPPLIEARATQPTNMEMLRWSSLWPPGKRALAGMRLETVQRRGPARAGPRHACYHPVSKWTHSPLPTSALVASEIAELERCEVGDDKGLNHNC